MMHELRPFIVGTKQHIFVQNKFPPDWLNIAKFIGNIVDLNSLRFTKMLAKPFR